jgi:hypothetical protein
MGKRAMHDEWYPETERLLAKYWHNQERIQRLKVREKLLRDQIETLDKDLCQLIHIRDFPYINGVISFKARMGDQDYSNRLERQEIQISAVSETLFIKYKKLIHVQNRMFQLEEFDASMKTIIDLLSDEEKKLVERRYIHGDSNYQIGYFLHCSEHRIRNIHYRIINTIAQRLGKKNGRNPVVTKA